MRSFLFFSCHCLLLSIIHVVFFYRYMWFDTNAQNEERERKKNDDRMKSEKNPMPWISISIYFRCFWRLWLVTRYKYVAVLLLFMIVTHFKCYSNRYAVLLPKRLSIKIGRCNSIRIDIRTMAQASKTSIRSWSNFQHLTVFSCQKKWWIHLLTVQLYYNEVKSECFHNADEEWMCIFDTSSIKMPPRILSEHKRAR